MSDRDSGDRTTSPSARAAAASRARRIGGRPVQKESPVIAPEAETPVAETPVAETPVAEAPRPRPRPRPGPGKAPAPKAAPAAAAGNPLLAWAPAIVLAVAALVFAVLIAVEAGSGSASSSAKDRTKVREQVLAAAKQCAAQVNTYDYRQLDQSEAKAKACATGKYLVDYTNTFDHVIKSKAPTAKATQSVEIDVAGIENVSEDGKTWKVLLFGQVKSVNTGTGSQGRYDPEAIQVTMSKVGSAWLISELIGV